MATLGLPKLPQPLSVRGSSLAATDCSCWKALREPTCFPPMAPTGFCVRQDQTLVFTLWVSEGVYLSQLIFATARLFRPMEATGSPGQHWHCRVPPRSHMGTAGL